MQTVLIIVGVAAGVAVIAYISALISGLQDNTWPKRWVPRGARHAARAGRSGHPGRPGIARRAALTETQPRAQRLRSVANWQALCAAAGGLPAVAGVSPMVSGSGLALRGEASQAIALMGVGWTVMTAWWACAQRSSAAARGWRQARR